MIKHFYVVINHSNVFRLCSFLLAKRGQPFGKVKLVKMQIFLSLLVDTFISGNLFFLIFFQSFGMHLRFFFHIRLPFGCHSTPTLDLVCRTKLFIFRFLSPVQDLNFKCCCRVCTWTCMKSKHSIARNLSICQLFLFSSILSFLALWCVCVGACIRRIGYLSFVFWDIFVFFSIYCFYLSSVFTLSIHCFGHFECICAYEGGEWLFYKESFIYVFRYILLLYLHLMHTHTTFKCKQSLE